MARHIAWIVAVLLLGAGPARAAGLGASCDREQAAKQQQPQQRGGHPPAETKPDKDKPGDSRPKWWIDQKLRAELGINDQQSAAVDKVWQKSIPALMEGRQKLSKLEDTLSQMTATGADEAAVIAQIGKVEDLRAELAKGRTLMIYRMNNLLSPDQRAKVKAMFERREGGRRGPSSNKSSSDK